MANGTKDRIPQIFTATINLGSDLVMFGSMFVLLSQLSPSLAGAVVSITLPYILLDQHIYQAKLGTDREIINSPAKDGFFIRELVG